MLPPRKIILELVEGCDLRCPPCGISGIHPPGHPFRKFIQLETIMNMVGDLRRLDWDQTEIHLSGRGEPSLHPDLKFIVKTLSSEETNRRSGRLRIVRLFTNANGLNRAPALVEHVADLFTNGLHQLIILQVPGGAHKLSQRELITLKYYIGADYDIKGKTVVPGTALHESANIIYSILPPLSVRRNFAGVSSPKVDTHRYTHCHRPSIELFIRWDGMVSLCQDDWEGKYICGDLKTNSIRDVWEGAALRAARAVLQRDRTDIDMCSGCNSNEYWNEKVKPEPIPPAEIRRGFREVANLKSDQRPDWWPKFLG